MTQQLHSINPEAKLIEVHCDDHLVPSKPSGPDEPACPEGHQVRWSPGSGCTLSAFLAQHISDLDIGSIEVVEWPPAERVFGDVYHRIKSEVRHFLQERRATVHTTGKFGRLWLRNTIKRIAALPTLINTLEIHAPIIIAASGPSLEKSIPLLHRYQESLFIMALPSSILALEHAGIHPDMIVHSDPGFFAEYHTRAPRSSGAVTIEAAPLYSNGYRQNFSRLLVLSTDNPIEQFFTHTLKMSPTSLDSHGTVAGIAFQLAIELSNPAAHGTLPADHHRRPVVFCGLDFCFKDILGHTTPHSFDPLLFSSHSRLEPIQDVFYKRSPRAQYDNICQTYALERYAVWFQNLSPAYRNQIFRLFPSEVEIDAFTNIDASGFVDLLAGYLNAGRTHTWTAETQRIPVSKINAALIHYAHTLHSQYDEFATRAAGSLLHTLRAYPLLLEFVQYTDYPILFKLQRGTADFSQLQKSVENHLEEIDSIIQAVQLT